MHEVKALVLAAGLSKRFGGPNKLLQPWRDTTVVGSVVRALLASGIEPLVVTGRDAELVAAEVAPAQTIFNSRFAEGLGTSIACGIAALPPCRGVLICLGDMPDLRQEVISGLFAMFESAVLNAILAPIYTAEPDRVGHPVLFGAAHFAALSQLSGDNGAKAILQANQNKLQTFAFEGNLDDIDSPEQV